MPEQEILYKGVLPEILARVTSRVPLGPRGPDVLHRVRVRRGWLISGEVVELELPRNLACAECGGGGCDACGRSGAITLRGKDDPPEMVEVTLPARPADELPDSRGLTLRIPEQGGLPAPGSGLPRGMLLLTVVASSESDPSVKLLRGVPSKQPPASIVESDDAPRLRPGEPERRGLSPATTIVLVAVLLWIALLIWLRLSGRG